MWKGQVWCSRFGGGRHAQGQGGRWYDNAGSRAGDGAQGGNRFDHHWNIGFGSHAGPNGGNLNPSLAVPAFFGGCPAVPPLFGAGSAGVPAAVPPGPGAGGRGVVFPASVPAGGTFFQGGGVGAALGSALAAGNFVPASGGLPVSVGLAVGGAGAASFAAPSASALDVPTCGGASAMGGAASATVGAPLVASVSGAGVAGSSSVLFPFVPGTSNDSDKNIVHFGSTLASSGMAATLVPQDCAQQSLTVCPIDVNKGKTKVETKGSSKPYCYICYTKGHTLHDCSSKFYCEICEPRIMLVLVVLFFDQVINRLLNYVVMLRMVWVFFTFLFQLDRGLSLNLRQHWSK